MRTARLLLAFALYSLPVNAQTNDVEFFESKIRPVLATRCFGCHSSKLAAPKGDLVLDTKAGLAKEGEEFGRTPVSGERHRSRSQSLRLHDVCRRRWLQRRLA